MQDKAHAAGTPTAHQGGPLEEPLEQLRLARGCASPSGGLRPVRGGVLPSSGLRLARGPAPPRAGTASLEGPSRPRPGSATLEGAPHTCAGPRTRAFNALTPAGRRHHAPGARAPVPPHQLPREEPIPITVGRDCAARPVSVPCHRAPAPVRLTCRALEGGPVAPSICFLVTLQG
jgi:hypothetical protein